MSSSSCPVFIAFVIYSLVNRTKIVISAIAANCCFHSLLIAGNSEYGWKIVGEYQDNELAKHDHDTKKMKKVD